jgi:beta-phosphoglucomutase
MLKGAIFDMDGVLVDSHPAHERAWKKLLMSMGKVVSAAELEFIREGRKKEEMLKTFLGDIPDHEMRRYCEEKDVLFQKEAESIRTIVGVRKLLGEMRQAGILSAVASCGGRTRVHRLLNVLQLKTCFAAVVTADDVILDKPDPEIFLKAAEQIGLPPSEIVAFEDSVSGVLAAVAAGIKCIGIASSGLGQRLLQAGAERLIPDFSGASLIRVRRWFSSQPPEQSHEKSANSVGLPQPAIPNLETC